MTLEELNNANERWGCNCGPSSLAAICRLALDDVRPHMGDFESKRYTNPTLMFAALRSLGRRHHEIGPRNHTVGRPWPMYGLARIQWEGPWTAPGVPMRARYRQTHWVGAWTTVGRGIGIWDCNALGNGTGWVSLDNWKGAIVPFITADIPRASGGWHVTHSIEVAPPESV